VSQESKQFAAKKRQRHPLLFYRRLYHHFRGISIALFVIGLPLAVWNPPTLRPYAVLYQLAAVLGLLLFLITFSMSRVAYVQARPDTLRIQLPFYALDLPYRLVKTTRLAPVRVVFPPEEQSRTRRSYLEPLWDLTTVVIELAAYPQPRPWLRLWLGDLMLVENHVILLIEEWMALRSAVDEAVAKIRYERTTRR